MTAPPPSILIVDDLRANLLATQAVLEPLGLRVVTATSGEEALRHLLDEEFAAVLLDVQMPGLDGFETARLIRARERTRELPILFVTALDRRSEHLEHALASGMSDLVYKPVDATALRAKVSILVRLYEQARRLRLQAEQLERAARAERSRFEATFEVVLRQMPAGALVVETDTGRVLLANERARALLGAPLSANFRDSLVGAGGLSGPLLKLLARALSAGEPALGERVTLESRPGGRRTVEVSVAAVLGEEGRPVAAVAVLHDVTELLAAQEDLREAAAFRERFMGILGHDLRSPLNAAMVSAHLLGRRELPAEAQVQVERIARACETMRALVHDLLDLTRARQAGGIPVSPAEVDLATTCRQVVEEVRAANPGALIELEAPPLRAMADAARLGQALTNLVTNAVRYRREGTPVRVVLAEEGGAAVIEVHNQGEPIPPELLPHLFEAYRRGPAAEGRRARTPGLGLGLYIAHEIALAHRGDLAVRSTAEAGTTFTLTLPLARKA